MLFARSGAQSRRVGNRAAAAVGAAAAVALTMTACGSGSSSSGSGSSSSGSGSSSSSASSGSAGSSQKANVAAAKAAIAPYTGHPTAFPVTEPLSKPLPAGKKFAYLQCGAQACAVAAKSLGPAVHAIGGTLFIVNAGATSSTAQSAVSTVLAMKPDVVLATGINPNLYGDGLKKLSDAGAKVVTVSIATATKPFGIDFNYLGAATFQRNGRLLADWVVANKGAGAHVAFYGVPELTFSPVMQQAFEQELKKNCSSCTFRAVPVGIATLGTTAPRTIVTDLQAHSGTNTAVFSTGNLTAGLPAALKAAGLSLTTLTYSPQAVNLQDIKTGGLTAGLASDYQVSLWTPVDAAARLLEGSQPTAREQAGEGVFQFLGQKDITFDPTNGWAGYPDFAQRFKKLWHTAS